MSVGTWGSNFDDQLAPIATTLPSMRLLVLGGIMLFAAGCAEVFDPRPPVYTQEHALEAARWAYSGADEQGVNMRQAPCIFFNGGSWIVVVDVTGKRTFRDAVKPCTFGTAGVKHAVVLDREGKVLFAQ